MNELKQLKQQEINNKLDKHLKVIIDLYAKENKLNNTSTKNLTIGNLTDWITKRLSKRRLSKR